MTNEGARASVQNGSQRSFLVLHGAPVGPIESRWRACLANADFPTHYTAPEYFLEPALRGKRPFAILSLAGDDVTAALTGINDCNHIQSGLSVRPQIAISQRTDRARSVASLVAGLLAEAASAKLVDLFVWSDMEALVAPRFHRRQYEGVVMLDLTHGPDALFRKFSENKRRNIKTAIRRGVSVESATSVEDVSAYYEICVDWSRRKALPVPHKDEFQQTFALTKNRRLFLARHEGKIIAGVVVRFFPCGVMEYAANSSLESALQLRPNDLLHWHVIKWGCAEGMSKYSLGGTHLFLRKFGGLVVPTIRCRLDMSLFHRYAVGDWLADKTEQARLLLPEPVNALGRSVRTYLNRRPSGSRRLV
jgi:hypothetical protein